MHLVIFDNQSGELPIFPPVKSFPGIQPLHTSSNISKPLGKEPHALHIEQVDRQSTMPKRKDRMKVVDKMNRLKENVTERKDFNSFEPKEILRLNFFWKIFKLLKFTF